MSGRTVLCDLEAGIGTVLRLEPGAIDVVLVIAEPTAKAVDVAARSARIAEHRASVLVVANKVQDDGDLDLIRTSVGGREIVPVPADPLVEEADRRGVAPIDLAPDSTAVRAMADLGALLDARRR